MKKSIFSITIICFYLFLNTPGAQADMTGAGDAAMLVKLSSIYTKIKEQYENQLKLIKEAKVQSENLKEVQEMATTAKKEFKFVKNFNLERELKNIENDVYGLSLLDNLDGKSPDRQFDMMMREIDRRFEGKNSKASVAAKRKLASQLASLKRLAELQKIKNEEAGSFASGGKSEKDALTSLASSNALIAALQIANEQRRLEQEMLSTDEKHERETVHKAFGDALDRMSQ